MASAGLEVAAAVRLAAVPEARGAGFAPVEGNAGGGAAAASASAWAGAGGTGDEAAVAGAGDGPAGVAATTGWDAIVATAAASTGAPESVGAAAPGGRSGAA